MYFGPSWPEVSIIMEDFSVKKTIIFLTIFTALFLLSACGGSTNNISQQNGTTPNIDVGVDTNTNFSSNIYEPAAPLTDVGAGDVIQFGSYSWRVLDVQGDRALIITESVISNQYHYPTQERVVVGGQGFIPQPDLTWENSYIRQYLNNNFYNSFDAADRARILETTVITNDNPWTGLRGGNNTTDRIFLLCIEEVVMYFGDSGVVPRQLGPAESFWIDDEYNSARAARDMGGTAHSWWLRSSGRGTNTAAFVEGEITDQRVGGGIGVAGAIDITGTMVSNTHGVRPALWLNISNGIIDSLPQETAVGLPHNNHAQFELIGTWAFNYFREESYVFSREGFENNFRNWYEWDNWVFLLDGEFIFSHGFVSFNEDGRFYFWYPDKMYEYLYNFVHNSEASALLDRTEEEMLGIFYDYKERVNNMLYEWSGTWRETSLNADGTIYFDILPNSDSFQPESIILLNNELRFFWNNDTYLAFVRFEMTQ